MSSICLIFSKIKVASMEKNYQVRRQSELIHGSKTYLIHEKLQFHAQSPNTFKTVFSSCFSWALWITVLWFAECSWFFFNIKQYWYIFFPNNDKQVDWTYFFFNFTRKIHILITKKKKKKHCAKFGFFNFIQPRLLFHESNHFSVFINSDLELLLSTRTIFSLYPYK